MELASTMLGDEKYRDYNKMHIVTYAIGSPFTQKEIVKNPHLKFSVKKDDTGVIVSWNSVTQTEFSEEKYENFISWRDGILVTNPVSWETNEKAETLGNGIVVKADIARGVLLVGADEEKLPDTLPAIGKLHLSEILLFAESIKKNIKDRILSRLQLIPDSL
jgi:hypothetical protein